MELTFPACVLTLISEIPALKQGTGPIHFLQSSEVRGQGTVTLEAQAEIVYLAGTAFFLPLGLPTHAPGGLMQQSSPAEFFSTRTPFKKTCSRDELEVDLSALIFRKGPLC
ncbi:UNVERIFIED_CONTAM: hypothetical protein K2H54_033156 [Gekko kuhli]